LINVKYFYSETAYSIKKEAVLRNNKMHVQVKYPITVRSLN